MYELLHLLMYEASFSPVMETMLAGIGVSVDNQYE